ncbi:MAG: hypothetical protein ABIT16_13180 [Croceibacterium sp.]
MASYLTEADHQRVSDAVAAAELNSAGEIVTVVADRSDGYSDVVLAWAALIGFTALTLFALLPAFFLAKLDWLLGGWTTEWSQSELLGIAATLAVGKFLAVWLVLQWEPLRFLLIPGPIKTARTRARAIDLFKVGAERRTHGRTGIMIYLSMRERRAEIVADEAIVGKVTPDVWGEAMAALLAEVRHGRVADGMIAAVGKVGVVLAQHFPRAEDDQNELPDRLIEL